LQLEWTQQIQPALRLEQSKAEKREGTLVRRLDSIAAITARRFREETATRKAATTLLSQRMDTSAEEDPEVEEYADQLRQLRAKIREERKKRKEEDERVLKEIHRATAAMKRALLQAVGTGDS